MKNLFKKMDKTLFIFMAVYTILGLVMIFSASSISAVLYNKLKECYNKQAEKVIFLHRFKAFILNLGITDKTMYESCIRGFIYNKKSMDFVDFFECCLKIMKLDFEQNYIKYKCIFYI